MQNLTTHQQTREQFYQHYPNFWYDMYGAEYALYDVYPVSSSFVEDTRLFAKKASEILFKTCRLLQQDAIPDETLLSLGFPKETLSYIRLQTTVSPTIIGRIDSVLHNGVHKIMEFNSDTPAFIYELFHMNGKVANKLGYDNPNEGCEQQLQIALKNSLLEAYSVLGKKSFPHIVFTSHHLSKEDSETVRYLQAICPLPSTYVPLGDLTIVEGVGLFDPNGNQIDVLHRETYPIEQFVTDTDEHGSPIGVQLLQLVEDKKLAIVNPPSAFLLQTKAILSIIWGLHEEQSPFFTYEEHATIAKHFLPTYLENDAFLVRQQKYVRKPVFGREGDTVEVYDGNGQKVDEDLQKTYQQYMSVYQEFIPLPTTMFQSVKGKQIGHMMYGTFVVNGEVSACGIRVGAAITNDYAYFLPMGLEKIKQKNN